MFLKWILDLFLLIAWLLLYQQIDTKEIAAKQFGFSSNKPGCLLWIFGADHKDDTDFQLWVDCLEGNKKL